MSALSLAAVLLIGSALRRVTGRTACDPVTVLAHRFRSMHPLVPSLAVAAGGLTTLVAMEFAEQFAAFGHVQDIGDALGGNPVAGVTVIVVAAALIALAGLRFARALVASAAAVAVALAAWIVAVPRQGPDGAASVRRVLRRRHASAPAFLARCSGLRAPPSAPV